MSLDQLHDLAGKLRDHREQQLKQGFVGPNMEAKLLAEAFLQAVHEIADLERRVSALEELKTVEPPPPACEVT